MAKNKKVRFSLTTNGLLLTPDKLDVLDRYNVNLTLSLDGPRVVHDKFRVTEQEMAPSTRSWKLSKR